jgi:hypothetical protein
MEDQVKIANSVLCVLSAVSTLMLLGYTVFQYCTNPKGGIYTGFGPATSVSVALGMCIYCVLMGIEKTILVYSESYERCITSRVIMNISQYLHYFFSICWLNGIRINNLRKNFRFRAPKYNRLPRDYGCNYSGFKKWLIYTIGAPISLCASAILLYIKIGEQKAGKNDKQNDDFKKRNFYPALFLNIVSGVLVMINFILITILMVTIAKKSRLAPKKDPPQTPWSRLSTAMKDNIKLSVIITTMWTIHFISWSINEFSNNCNNEIAFTSAKVLEIIYSLQGMLLFCSLFIYRSDSDPNPVINFIKNPVSTVS